LQTFISPFLLLVIDYFSVIENRAKMKDIGAEKA